MRPMERVRGHRIAGPVGGYSGERHYGYLAAAGMLINWGGQAWAAAEAPSGKVPVKIRAEMALQRQRQDLAFQQQYEAYQMQKLLQPYLLEQMGLEATRGANGEITGLRKRPPTRSDLQAATIKDMANEKVLKGLRGEADIDPGATRALNARAQEQKEYLARTLGPDYALSTAGGTALSREAESRIISESAIRRDEMAAAEALAQGRIANEFQKEQFQTGLAAGYPRSMSQMAMGSMDMANRMQFPDTEVALAEYRGRQARRQVWPNYIQGVGKSLTSMGMGGMGASGGGGGLMGGMGGGGEVYSPKASTGYEYIQRPS
ncbi:MAG: hypothetical protein A2V88_05665 [Elusimicrobia bacterium RBG_16_66_12]|nr:MAG: hypothetical protein A2V88_05665 [Elusimicrobia bacterium RBG_16_66_12]